MKPKIYISGPIVNDINYKNNFQTCQDFLIQEGIFNPINPAAIVIEIAKKSGLKLNELNEENYFKIALSLMLDIDCKDFIILPNFFNKVSRCTIELKLAIDLNYTIHEFSNGMRVKL